MKFVLLLFVLSTSFSALNKSNHYSDEVKLIDDLRLSYYAGVDNEEYIDTLKKIIISNFGEEAESYSPLILAYNAGIYALQSKHAFWPFTKMSYLNDSMELFEKAINKEPDNLEIRFMRFSILYYVPGILGYAKEKKNDLEIIYNLLLQNDFSNVSYEIQQGIVEFLLESEMLSSDETKILKNRFILAKLNE